VAGMFIECSEPEWCTRCHPMGLLMSPAEYEYSSLPFSFPAKMNRAGSCGTY
jgi:hypothetical protein